MVYFKFGTGMESLELYGKYYSSRNYELLELFTKINDNYHIRDVLYPGSFVHITPSLVFSHVVYVDSDKQAAKFFKDPFIYRFVEKNKQYPEQSRIDYHHSDFYKDFGEREESFDLLISQYSGFVSQACKKYLREGGLLVTNNSHGDASMASIDQDFELIAVYHLNKGKCSISGESLNEYFLPKKETAITKDFLFKKQRGIAYTKSPSGYLFRKL